MVQLLVTIPACKAIYNYIKYFMYHIFIYQYFPQINPETERKITGVLFSSVNRANCRTCTEPINVKHGNIDLTLLNTWTNKLGDTCVHNWWELYVIVYEYWPETTELITCTNALQNRCYTCIQWTRVLYSLVITWQSNPPISQFNCLCNEFTNFWSMFIYNIL